MVFSGGRNSRGGSRSGSKSSTCSAYAQRDIPIGVDQLLRLVAAEFEAVQRENKALKAQLKRNNDPGAVTPSTTGPVAGSISLQEPTRADPTRKLSVFQSGFDTLRSFSFNAPPAAASPRGSFREGSFRTSTISSRSASLGNRKSTFSNNRLSTIFSARPSRSNSTVERRSVASNLQRRSTAATGSFKPGGSFTPLSLPTGSFTPLSVPARIDNPDLTNAARTELTNAVTHVLSSASSSDLMSVIPSPDCCLQRSSFVSSGMLEVNELAMGLASSPSCHSAVGRRNRRSMTAPGCTREALNTLTEEMRTNDAQATKYVLAIPNTSAEVLGSKTASARDSADGPVRSSSASDASEASSDVGEPHSPTLAPPAYVPGTVQESSGPRKSTAAPPSPGSSGWSQNLKSKLQSFEDIANQRSSVGRQSVGSKRLSTKPTALHSRISGLYHVMSLNRVSEGTSRDFKSRLEMDLEGTETAGCFIMSPISYARLCWDFSVCACFLVDIWTTLFCLVFLGDIDSPAEIRSLTIARTTFFLLHILVEFHTGHVVDGELICDCGIIARKYICSWFLFDVIATIPWSFFLPRGAAVVCLIRFARLPYMPSFSYLWHVLRCKRYRHAMAALLIAMSMWLIFAHTHACLWQIARTHDGNTAKPTDFDDALDDYHESFWWAFTAFAFGSRSGDLPWVRTLEIAIACERFVLFVFMAAWSIFQMAVFYKDPADTTSIKDDALRYMRSHGVGALTQLQVARTIQDVTVGNHTRENFYGLVSSLPMELRQTISKEMWSGPLLSLQLIANVVDWHNEFMPKLLMMVSEESLPPQAILCHEGETQKKACKIVSGRIQVETKHSKMPDLLEGMWVGENALVNSYLRSNATSSARLPSMLMSLPVNEFHQLLTALGLADQYKQSVAECLWRGLCGRCGAFGDHFPHECHTIVQAKPGKQRMSMGVQALYNRSRSSTVAAYTSERDDGIKRDLQEFLAWSQLDDIVPVCQKLQIRTLMDLEAAVDDMEVLPELLEGLPYNKKGSLTPIAIQEFCKRAAEEVREKIEMSTPKKCLVFLSHYKVEAGTEAALMRAELQLLIDKDPRQLGKYFEVPVFLDSENLSDLDALQQNVIDSHNVVLLLTKGVLTRPWVLVEILTAVRHGVPIIPLQIVKPEAEFEFPNDDFYVKLRNGEFLDQDSMQVLHDCNVNVTDLEKALRGIFKRIAIRYSPHRAASIRKAELESLLREVSLRKDAK